LGRSAWACTPGASALHRPTAGKMGVTTYIVPALVVLMSWAFLAETPRPLAYLGGALCLAGVAISRGRRQPVRAEPVAEEPVAEGPLAEEPVAVEPVAVEPGAEEPVAEEPVAEEPVTGEPVAGKPVTGSPVTALPHSP